jgi:hypothetical protein
MIKLSGLELMVLVNDLSVKRICGATIYVGSVSEQAKFILFCILICSLCNSNRSSNNFYVFELCTYMDISYIL